MTTTTIRSALLASACAIALAACASAPRQTTAARPTPARPMASVSTVQQAHVNLSSASASLVSGRLLLRAKAGGVQLSGEIGGLVPNSTHAIHIHENGDCSAADASSAGGHFNPLATAHGRSGMPVHHAGDMDNLVANSQGVATVDVMARNVVLGGQAGNDIIGRAVVVHAQADDYSSQPAGNAGARVACGVIETGS